MLSLHFVFDAFRCGGCLPLATHTHTTMDPPIAFVKLDKHKRTKWKVIDYTCNEWSALEKKEETKREGKKKRNNEKQEQQYQPQQKNFLIWSIINECQRRAFSIPFHTRECVRVLESTA